MIVHFEEAFRSLTGFSPMRWQCRLFKRFVDNDLPKACDIPTGLGKTSVMVIWLLALARQAEDGRVLLPRRLVYIVNRRTVVDQATAVVERIRHRLLEPEAPTWQDHADTLKGIASVLCRICASEEGPIGISTLRGELADNEEWKTDPTRPAVIVGTIDIIGSKLLFSGYGDGRYGRIHHAGLIGQDALIVHDEAHLTPAFSELLRRIADEQERSKEPRRIRVMELSATQRGNHAEAFELEQDDETYDGTGQIVKQRLDAQKRLHLHKSDDLVAGLVERALHIETPAKVLVYIRSPEDAQKLADAIKKELGDAAGERVALLTGTIRGYERDRLVIENPIYRALLDHEAHVPHSVFLVSTSAGEVGIDLDADYLVCDLTTLDSMIQRLGRVNRRGGEGREARVDAVWTDDDAKGGDKPFERAVAKTLETIQGWINGNGEGLGLLVSPRRLRVLVEGLSEVEREAAFSPKPTIPPLTDILLDNWSLTSIDKMPGRPEVAVFLHGLTFDPPETYVAWRREVSILDDAGVDEALLRDWFRVCRIDSRERLRDRTGHVKKALTALLNNLRKKDSSLDLPIVLLNASGGATWSHLSVLADDDTNLAYRTVVLPMEAGGLNENGMLDPKREPSSALPSDVAEDNATDRQRERWLHRRSSEGEQYERLASGEVFDALPDELREKVRIPLRQPDEAEDGAETLDLVLLVAPVLSALENPETTSARQTLAAHTDAIVEHMSRIAARLNLDDPIRTALIAGARWHDKGKDRPVWQRYARNGRGAELLAKAIRYLHPRALGGYRHEFGSLLDAMKSAELGELPERELVLHLIAAHHGWARPHFEPRSFDSSCTTAANNQTFSEVVRRFGQLQQRFGRWGLAWLESLVRCADIAASRHAAASTRVGSEREFVPEEAEA
ncbi:MAG: type I-U CRISPR-associated helicase/endonuclease Cas3 [Nitrospirota bacterium]